MARLPRPSLPSRGRIRERLRRRRDARGERPDEGEQSLEQRAAEMRRLLYGEPEEGVGKGDRPHAPRLRRSRSAAAGLLTGAAGALRRLRYGLGDAGFAVGRAARAFGGAVAGAALRVRVLWLRLSLATRRRIAAGAGLLAAAALLWFAVVPNLPCAFPAGETCPPADDAIELVPGDAYAYMHANIDTETEQYRAAAQTAERLPALSAQLVDLVREPGGRRLDFSTRIKPWAAGELAVAVVPGPGGRDERVLLVEVADPDGARAFVAEAAGDPLVDEEHRGVTIQLGEEGTAAALVGDFLAFGSNVAVRRVVDVHAEEARPLSSAPLATELLDELPDQVVAEVAVSEEGIRELLARDETLAAIEPFVNFEASAGAAAGLVAEGDAVELTLLSALDPARLEAAPGFFSALPPFAPGLAGELSPESLAYLGLGDPGASLERLLQQAAAGAPGVAAGFDDLARRLERRDRIDLRSELGFLLAGEAAIGIEPTDPEDPEGAPAPPGISAPTGAPHLVLVVEEIDDERARGALARLQGPIAEALDPQQTGQAPVFSKEEIEGVEARTLRLSRTVNLTYATFDGKLVVATDPRGIAQVRRDDGGLPESQGFEDATEGFPDQPVLLSYLNMASLIVLAEREGLAVDPRYAFFAADIRRLTGLGLAVERSPESLETTMRVAVSE